ncbi:MAG: lipid II flippase MurJ [Patescibacteria group bacterium]
MLKARKSLLSDSVSATGANLFAQFFTFLISAIIAAQYGATENTDAFFYALAAVMVVNAAITGVLKSVFTSVFLRFVHKEKQDEKEILGSFYLYFCIFLLVIWSLFNITSYLVTAHVTIPGILDRELLFRMLFELSFLIIASGLVECLSTVYNTYQKYIIPILTPIFRSVVFIAFVWFTKSNLGVESLSIGNSFAELAHLVILFTILKYKGIYFGFKLVFHPAVKRMVTISLPSFLSNATTRINDFVDASFIAPVLVGGVTIINYANKISAIPAILLTGGFLTVILTHWSLKENLEGDDSLKESLLNSLIAVGMIFIPILVAMFVLREPLVKLLYERKNFTPDLTYKTALLTGLYLFGLLPLMLGRILTRAFLVIEDTWTPFWVGNIRAVINVVTNILFIKALGYPGVAVSTSFTSFLLFAFMFVKLKKKIRLAITKEYIVEWGKVLSSGAIAGFAIFSFYKFFVHSSYLYLSLSFIGGVVSLGFFSAYGLLVYLLSCYLLKVKKLTELKQLIFKKG